MKDNIIQFPAISSTTTSTPTLNAAEMFLQAVEEFEKRIGGASIIDIEDGDPEAIKIMERALQKEYLQYLTLEIYEE